MYSKVVIFIQLFLNAVTSSDNFMLEKNDTTLNDHTMVTDSNVFPYVVAVLNKALYISAGALISDSWVLTAADGLFTMQGSMRMIRLRLGSLNYRKGGLLLRIKNIEIHPYFDDKRPEFDVALLQLSGPVRFTPHLNPIRLQKRRKEVMLTHYIVTAWPKPSINMTPGYLQSPEQIKKRRILYVSHLHPIDPEKCSIELDLLGVNSTTNIMCLDPDSVSDPCVRDAGAPVVLNGILLGIMSSWKPEDCDVNPSPNFVNLVSATLISSWINTAIKGEAWNPNTAIDNQLDDYDDE